MLKLIDSFRRYYIQDSLALIWLFVFFLTFVFFWFGSYSFSNYINVFDDGILPVGSMRILNGEMPYRDFFSVYAPINFVFLSFVFKFFGTSFFVYRVFTVLVSFLALITIYFSLRIFSKKILFSFLFSVVLLFLSSPLKLTHFFVFLSLIFFFLFIKNPKKIFFLILTGLSVGFLFFTRVDFGLVFIFCCFVSLFFIKKSNNIFTLIINFFIGFGIVALPLFLWLYLNDSLLPFFNQNILYLFSGNYRSFRGFPLSKLFDWSFESFNNFILAFFWFFVFLLMACVFLFNRRDSFRFSISFLMIFLVLSLPYLLVRNDVPHLNFVGVFSWTFLYFTLLNFKRFSDFILLIIFIISMSFFGQSFDYKFNYNNEVSFKKYDYYPYDLAQNDVSNDFELLLKYIKENIPLDEKIYIGLKDHSKVYINNILLYFFIGREVPTFYHEFFPGITNTYLGQTRIVKELQNLNYLILWDFFVCEPNESCNSSNVFVLDQYISKNFYVEKIIGSYFVMKRI